MWLTRHRLLLPLIKKQSFSSSRELTEEIAMHLRQKFGKGNSNAFEAKVSKGNASLSSEVFFRV
jgi:translation initiation factor 2 alpha subunit (eIF-2alpha)